MNWTCINGPFVRCLCRLVSRDYAPLDRASQIEEGDEEDCYGHVPGHTARLVPPASLHIAHQSSPTPQPDFMLHPCLYPAPNCPTGLGTPVSGCTHFTSGSAAKYSSGMPSPIGPMITTKVERTPTATSLSLHPPSRPFRSLSSTLTPTPTLTTPLAGGPTPSRGGTKLMDYAIRGTGPTVIMGRHLDVVRSTLWAQCALAPSVLPVSSVH